MYVLTVLFVVIFPHVYLVQRTAQTFNSSAGETDERSGIIVRRVEEKIIEEETSVLFMC
jgi:hypothetical protein